MNRRTIAILSLIGFCLILLVVLAVMNHSERSQRELARFEEQAQVPMRVVSTIIESQAKGRPLVLFDVDDLMFHVKKSASYLDNPWTNGPFKAVDARQAGTAEPGDLVFGFDQGKGAWFLAAVNPERALVLTRYFEDYVPPEEPESIPPSPQHPDSTATDGAARPDSS